MVFLYCFLRLNLKTSTFAPRPLPRMVAFDRSALYQFAFVLEGGLDGQFDLGAHVAGQLFHAQHIAWRYPVLFSAGLNNCVHRNLMFLGAGHTKCVWPLE